jgi:Tol biopolymer transport system component/outer membrane protein assembly factor BamD (BamD/ComL family)
MIQYEDFSIKIEPQREGVYPVIVLRSPAGEGRASFRLPFELDDLGDLLVDLGRTVRGSSQRPTCEAAPGATSTRPQQVGDQLFNALFAGPVRSLLDQSLGMIRERQKGLRIKLHIDPEDASLARLASLPWELMYRKETRDFLNLSRYTPILRYLDVQAPYVPLTLEPPLRILVVISNPVDYARLNLEHEQAQIERTWAQQENVEVSFLEKPSISALQDRLEREPFHALHYMGHGDFDQRSGSGVLFLEDESGHGVPVDGRTLGILLRDVPTLRLVFLNACETARVTRQVGLDPFAGVAAAIVMVGVPAVVAMQFPITDVAAIRFAGRFYPLVALGEPVDYAVAEGRRAIRVAEGDTMEWATPVLFMRAPEGVLFRVAETHRAKRPRPQPPALDREQEQRLEERYISGLGAFWLEEWDRACHHFQEIVDERPDYRDATARLEEAERKWHQNELYNQAQEARQAGSWTVALTRLEELVAEDPGYKDAAALLEMARRQRRLAGLYDQARQLHQAGQWLAVVRVFDQIATLDPDFPDPDDLLSTARQEAAEQERQAALNDLYSRAVLEMDAGHWEGAQQLLTRLLEREPGYREADRLLVRARAQILRLEEERQLQEQIATLYDRAAYGAGAGQWAQALAAMDEIRTLDPEFADPQGIAARARDKVERQDRLAALYAQAQAAYDAQDWPEALAALQALLGEDAGYRDAAAQLATVEVQQELAGLYAQARQQHQAAEWQAVVGTFARIAALEPGYADPEGLLPAARRSLAGEQRRAELDDRYARAVGAMDAGQWGQARALLAQIQEGEAGYRDVERLLGRAEAELAQLEAERRRREQIATLYEQAQSLARARQWRQALAKLDEIHALDAGFADPEGIAARARERVAQEEAEARRQNELATLYAEAVRLLKAGQYQEALEKWGEVQALDPRYPDRKKVQATAKKRLAALAKPGARRRLPLWAIAALAGLVLVIIVAAAALLAGGPGGGGTPETTGTAVPGVAAATATLKPASTPAPTRTSPPTVQVQQCASGVVFCDDFETGRADRWDLNGWIVVQDGDNYVLSGSVHHGVSLTTQGYAWGDHRVRFQLKLEKGGIHLDFRESIETGHRRYFVGFSESRLVLVKQVRDQFSDLVSTDAPPPFNRWCDVEILAVGGHLQVYIDGDLQLEYTDPDPLERGGISFETLDYSRAMVDDIEVRPAEEPRPAPTPTRTPTLLPLSGRIAFTSDRDGNSEIYVADFSGRGPTNLTNHPDEDWGPAWSPDGKRIAFTSLRDGHQEIYAMNADGSEQTRLTFQPGSDRVPCWSPDGNRIAFVSDRSGNDDIWVMDADGSKQTNLTNDPGMDDMCAWSPDGTRIAFTSERDGNGEIYVMNADGTGETNLTNNSAGDWLPYWSPDGKRVVFASSRDGNNDIYVMNANGSDQTNLTHSPSSEWIASWSPNGKQLAFVTDRDGNQDIWVMNADGSSPTRVINNPAEDFWPAWGP